MSQKILYLVRGLPGSGKTTLARHLQPDSLFRCAADDYFTDDQGRYDFRPEEIHLAHKFCQDSVRSRMIENETHWPPKPIVVHNTMSERWEANYYYDLAKDYGYSVFLLECQNEFENTHNVPESVVDKMKVRWQNKSQWNNL